MTLQRLARRNVGVEKARNQARNLFDKVNPYGTVTGKSFRIPLSVDVVKQVEGVISARSKGKLMTARQRNQVYEILNKSDTREFLAILAQELAKELSLEKQEATKLVATIKLATAASIYPVNNKGVRSTLADAASRLADLAEQTAEMYDKPFAEKLAATLRLRDEYDTAQEVIDGKVDLVRNHYWNKFMAVANVIGEEFERRGLPNEVARLFVETAKYQVLFNEISSHLNEPKKPTIVDSFGYSEVLNSVMRHYREVDDILRSANIKFAPSYLTHISESRERVNLSDLERMSLADYVSLTISYLLILAWGVIILLPLFQMLIFSFDGTRVSELGEAASVNNSAGIHYANLFEKTNFKYWLGNSLIVAGATMAITVFITTLLAYAFSRFKFRGRKTSLLSIMLLQLVPSVAALTAFLVLFSIMKEGIKINVVGFLIIIYTGGAITGNTFILKGYMDSIPRDLDEAAELDGSSKMRTFISILVPLAKPMIAIVALWSFIGPFGDVILPNLLNDGTLEGQKSLTMAAGLRTLITAGQGGVVQQYEYLAGAIITSVPIAVLFMFCQRFLVGGLTAGAVK